MTKSRLIITSLVGITALIAVSLSFSLAWYASSDRLAISSVDLSLRTDPLLKVSTSNELSTFVDELDLNSDELEEDGEKFLFKPVSPMYRDDWLTDQADEPIFYESSFAAVVDGDNKSPTEQGFYQKKLYLWTEGNYYVGIDTKQCVFENDTTANSIRAQALSTSKENKDIQLTVAEIEESLNKLINCLRVSILINDVEDSSKINQRFNIINPTKQNSNDEVLYGGLLDNDNDGYYDTVPIMDENNNPIEAEYLYGDINDRSLVKHQDPEIPGYEDERLEPSPRMKGNSFVGQHRKSVYTYDANASNEAGMRIKEEGALSIADLNNVGNRIIIPCYANQPREIVISIYLEGWDPDCINGTMGASFNTQLSFKILNDRGLM